MLGAVNVHYILVPFQREPTPFGLLSALGKFVLRAVHRTTWLTALTVDPSLPFGLLSNLHEAIEGCLSVDVAEPKPDEKRRILEIAV